MPLSLSRSLAIKPTPIACLFAALTGAIAVLGWAPFGMWPLGLVSYACLYWLLQNRQPLRAGLIGLAFGIGLHWAGHGWIYDALHTKTGFGMLSATLSTAFFVIFWALFTAVPCWIAQSLLCFGAQPRLRKNSSRWPAIFIYAGMLTLGEWGRSLCFNGFTSLSLGYSLVGTWLSGYAPITGLYGMSWLGFLLAGLLTHSLTSAYTTRRIATICILFLFLSGWALCLHSWTEPFGEPLTFRLIQANVAQEHKFDPLYMRQEVQRLVKMMEEAPADIIATPETAFPVFLRDLPADTLSNLQLTASRMKSNIFAGIATEAANSDGYNSVLQISPYQTNGEVTQYNKVRLMAFGEYSPAGFNWFTRQLTIPLKDMSEGDIGQPPFVIRTHGKAYSVGTLICLEDLIGQEARRWANSSNILLNPSNLAWFDGTIALEQPLQVIRMRALEIGRPILRIANTGVTAYVDAHGKVVAQLPVDQTGVLSGTIQPTQGMTPYAYVGDGLAISLSLAGILIATGLCCLYPRRRAVIPST